jgi:hypothetical protein
MHVRGAGALALDAHLVKSRAMAHGAHPCGGVGDQRPWGRIRQETRVRGTHPSGIAVGVVVLVRRGVTCVLPPQSPERATPALGTHRTTANNRPREGFNALSSGPLTYG